MTITSMPQNDASSQLERLSGVIAGRPEAAELHYQLAEACWRARDKLGYANCFRRAFLLKPTTKIAPSQECTDEELRERARALIDHGVGYASVIAALTVAETRLGNGAEVKYLMDYDRFVQHAEISLPKGTSVDDFNRVLASEIRAEKSDSRFYDSPAGRGIRHAWRIELFPHPKTPALKTLLGTLRSHAAHYISCLPHEPAHPFIRSRPAEFTMDGWAIVSNGTGYHKSHIHPASGRSASIMWFSRRFRARPAATVAGCASLLLPTSRKVTRSLGIAAWSSRRREVWFSCQPIFGMKPSL